MNGYGKLRRCTDKRKVVVESSPYLAATLTVSRRLINRARSRYRWPTWPCRCPKRCAQWLTCRFVAGRSPA
jgi:hypothetical protein